jgi:hypothetical protein
MKAVFRSEKTQTLQKHHSAKHTHCRLLELGIYLSMELSKFACILFWSLKIYINLQKVDQYRDKCYEIEPQEGVLYK